MASKVNKKFVVAVVVGVLAMVGLAVGVVAFGIKSAADHMRAGDELVASGEFEKAASSYSRAVSKEPNNTTALSKWIGALEKLTPSSRQAYEDKLRNLLGAKRRMAEVKRSDLAAHREVLEPDFQSLRRQGGNVGGWQGLVQGTEAMMKIFPAGDRNVDGLKRYRGTARTALLGMGQTLTAEELAEALSDLEAAVAFDPQDAHAASALSELLRLKADRARDGADPEGEATLRKRSLEVIGGFVERNPGSGVGRMTLANVQAQDVVRRAQAGGDVPQFQAELRPIAEQLLAAVEREDPASMDVLALSQATSLGLANRVENADARALALFDRVIAARPNEPLLAFMRAEFLMQAGQPVEAAESFLKISEMPNLPLSRQGLELFGRRDQALTRRVDALLRHWEMLGEVRPVDTAKRAAALAEARKARDVVQASASIDELPKLLIDGKLAMAAGDLSEARKLLGVYNQRTQDRNVEALLLLARVLEQQRLLGEARQCYMKIIEARQGNLTTYLQAANLDIELKNFESAMELLTQAERLSPGNAAITQQKERISQLLRGTETSDPLIRLLAEAERAANATPPDFKLAASKMNQARPLLRDAAQYLAMAQVQARMNQVPDAQKTADEGAARFPDSAPLRELAAALRSTDPIGDAARRIRESGRAEVEQQVELFILFSRAGDAEKAKAAMAEAERLNADHPVVVSSRFEEALQAKDMARATELAGRAKRLNLDKVGGRLYEASLLRQDGKFREAIVLVEQATELDPVNPMAWRLLGELRLLNRETAKGVAALERAIQIQPNDAPTIVAVMRAHLAGGNSAAALATARDAQRFGLNDWSFVNLWLNLEFDSGQQGQELAIDRRRRVFDNNPDNIENAVALATIQLRRGLVADASATVEAVERSGKAAPQARLLRAAILGVSGDFAASERAFDEAVAGLDQNDMDGSMHLDFSRLMLMSGRAEFAASMLQKGLRYEKPETMIVSRTLGDTLFNTGRFGEALEAYGRARGAIKDDTDNLLLKRMVECLLRLERLADAEKLLGEVDVAKSEDVQLILLSAELQHLRGDAGAARSAIDRAIRVNPNSAVAFIRRGDFNLADPKTLDDAQADYARALEIDGRSTRARLSMAATWARKGEAQRALDTLTAGLNLEQGNEELREAHVQLLLNMGRVEGALSSLNEVMSISTDPRWPQLAGLIKASSGDLPGAAEMFRRSWSVAKNPTTGKALVDTLLGLTPPGLAEARRVVEAPEFLADSEPFSRLSRARLLKLEGKAAAAEADAKAAVSKLGVDMVRESLMVMDELRRTWTEPVELLAVLDRIAPSEGWPEPFALTVSMARVSVEAQREQALREISALMGSKDKRVATTAASMLGSNLFQQGRGDEAVAAFQRGLQVDAENVELLNNLAYVLSKGLGRHAEALPMAERAVEREPTNPNVLDTLGAVQLELGQLDKAEELFNRARNLTPDALQRTMPTLHLAEVKMRKRDTTTADLLLREVAEFRRRDPRVAAQYGREIDRVEQLRQQLR
jgi:tetratricopeptide (TPR) repeat protein